MLDWQGETKYEYCTTKFVFKKNFKKHECSISPQVVVKHFSTMITTRANVSIVLKCHTWPLAYKPEHEKHILSQFSFLVVFLLISSFQATCSPLSEFLVRQSEKREISFNPSELAKIGSPAVGLEVIKQLAQALHGCGVQGTPSMRRVYLSNETATCNDGTPAGYYLRKSYNSKRWLMFLEGGWYCFDHRSCLSRYLNMRNLMSSEKWPETRRVGGIMSDDPEENPYWWNANHVYIPYCSSDTWSGATPASNAFAFLGARIIIEVIKDLLPRGLSDGDVLLLAGSSAGGAGVLVNLDRVADTLKSLNAGVEVRGLVDSGWFLDNEPYKPMECFDPHTCAPVEAIKQGIRLWNGQVPERCKADYDPEEHWRCYFGYRIYRTLKTPVFIFQWLFDEAQMTADNVVAPATKAQWDYIHNMGKELRRTLQNVSAVFAPSCVSHMILTHRNWQYMKIKGISFPQALRCWEIQKHEHNHHVHHSNHELYDKLPVPNGTSNSTLSVMLADMPTSTITRPQMEAGTKTVRAFTEESKKKNRRRERKRRRRRRRRRKQCNRENREKRKNRKCKKKRKKKNEMKYRQSRETRSFFLKDLNLQHRWTLHEDLCHHWLLDDCTWPQCNRHCPPLRDPYTGEEKELIELLKSFGLEMGSVADALEIDPKTLAEMDGDKLRLLLTQQKNE
ncbi:palmitoleoyl-protein carboxylesterase notum1-like isoform X2 [Tachypleus tridentatus]|uniref:palmitoleoyl-protein carboxylesterase notum1-like isoform X2 n=1 Tax=Tachypleus tridentatus TaxID=6853 RepID=UPI003FD41E8F